MTPTQFDQKFLEELKLDESRWAQDIGYPDVEQVEIHSERLIAWLKELTEASGLHANLPRRPSPPSPSTVKVGKRLKRRKTSAGS